MTRVRHLRKAGAICALFSSLVLPAAVPAQTTSATNPAPRAATAPEIELQRKLDAPFSLALQKVELSEAFKQIAGAGAIALQVDPACYDSLPYGATTRVTAEFRESRLRDAIEQVLVPLCLEQVVSGSTVIIRPTAPLARIGHRADWDELKLLQDIRTGSDLKSTGAPFDWTTALRAALDGHPHLVVSIAPPTPETAPLNDKAIDQLKKQFPISPFRALDLYCQLTNQIWFVEAGPASGATSGGGGGTVMIMPVRKWIDRQLQRPIKIDFTNAPLQQVVDELAHASGIHFTPEPGLYQTVPMVSVNSNNGSVEATLKALSGGARVAYDIRDDSIYLHMVGSTTAAEPANILAATAPAARTDPFVARISVPLSNSSASTNGMMLDFLIHESELPPELNELRKKKIQDYLDAMQKELTTPSPAPTATTQAATNSENK